MGKIHDETVGEVFEELKPFEDDLKSDGTIWDVKSITGGNLRQHIVKNT